MHRIGDFCTLIPDMTVEATITSIITILIADERDMLIALGDLPDSSCRVQAIGDRVCVDRLTAILQGATRDGQGFGAPLQVAVDLCAATCANITKPADFHWGILSCRHN